MMPVRWNTFTPTHHYFKSKQKWAVKTNEKATQMGKAIRKNQWGTYQDAT